MAGTPTATVARRMRALRQGKFTAEQLAQAMRDQGIPWQRTVVAKLENGRREALSVDELLALAVVLDVPPAALMVDLPAGTAQVTPAVSVLPAELLLWLWGLAELDGSMIVGGPPEGSEAVRQMALMWQSLQHLEASSATVPPADDPLGGILGRRRQLASQVKRVQTRYSITVPAEIVEYLTVHGLLRKDES